MRTNSEKQPVSLLIVHRTILLSLVALALAGTAVAGYMWQQENLHRDRLSLVNAQLRTAIELKNQLDDISPGSPSARPPIPALEGTTAAHLKVTSERLWKLHWEATHNRFAGFFSRYQTLHDIYNNSPFRMAERLDRIGDLGRIVSTDNPVAIRLLKAESDAKFLNGYTKIIDELKILQQKKNRTLLRLCILTLTIALLLLLAYHYLVFLPSQKRMGLINRELQETQKKLDTLSTKDPLTDTSNRKAITRFLSSFQRDHTNENEFIALAIVDIDHFQQINDVLGYFAGDAVLQEVAQRIQKELRSEDRLGRLDADHFAIILCGLVAPQMAEAIIHRIQQTIEQPIHYKDNNINVTCTVGANVQEVNSLNLAELFKLSDQALLKAKQNRRGSFFLLSEHAQEAFTRQREIINTINAHSPDELFSLAFQPIVSLKTRKIAGCECLLRWTADSPSELHADELIPILEMYGGIHTVGEWVLQESLACLQRWQRKQPGLSLFVSINVSALQLEADDFPARIIAMVSDYDISPGSVSLELTETIAIKHLETGRKQLAQLKKHGFGISLDDFGTGYSSLSYLKTMPISTVKIDQTFVRNMLADKRDTAIIDSTIHIAKAIGLSVIAEGIDSEAQAVQLLACGCDYGQGYYFSKPVDAMQFEQMIEIN